VTLRISLGCALLAIFLGACHQTLWLDDRSPDASLSGTGGRSGNGGSGGSGVGPTDASSSDAHCSGYPPQQIFFTWDTPQVVIALDRSTAMNQPFPNTNDIQLSSALNALYADVQSYGPSPGGRDNHPTIQFAFLDFPYDPTDCASATGCCTSVVTPTMDYKGFDDVAYTCTTGPPSNACIQSDHRPIANALSRANGYFSAMSPAQHGNERFVLLVADGDPSGCSTSGANGDCMDAITQIGNLTSLGSGVTTEVLAIGSSLAPNCLSLLAGAQTMTPYTASNSTDLGVALQEILSPIAQVGCRLTLSSLPHSSQLAVVSGGKNVPEDNGDGGNGWITSSDGSRVFLHGALCQSFLRGNSGLQIYDGCAPSGRFPNP
jgi:hypothetical protein